jgi:L-cysteine:1D-myo-inositol 2-amino-2-deoxy-alpha-D-glucopyranoside ligase
MPPALRLFDTLSGTVRPFEPSEPEVTLYVCGVTPYDTTHLGHVFTFGAFDVLIRYLRYLGYRVRYIQNITDVDDPLFAKARELGESYRDLAAQQTEQYFADMQALNILPAERYPRASEEIPGMIAMAETLVAGGQAYAVDGHVYFSVASDPEYGSLSKLSRPEMIDLARERGGDPDDARRRDPLDFLLWRPAQGDEPRTSSPWGEGLPGWHLECSVMSLKYLGAPIDIHGGGIDLVFPHHESEIAQSESATGTRPFVRHWMHTAMVYLGGEKMSKSLGNMVFARDLVKDPGPDAVRLYLAGTHYRSELEYDEAALREAAAVARDLAVVAALPPAVVAPDVPRAEALDPAPFRARFEERMSDDLDTPGAIALLRELAAAIGDRRSAGGDTSRAQQLLRELAGILGLRLGATG